MSIFSKIVSFINSGSSRTANLKKNVLASYCIKAVSILLGLVRVPLLLTYLDSEKYGVWLTIASMVMWIQHFDLGLGHGLRNKFAEAWALGDKNRARGLVSTAYLSMSVLMSLATIVIVAISFFVDWNSLLNVHSVSDVELRNTVIFTILMFTSRFVFQLISVLLKAIQKPAISDAFLPVESALSLLIIIALTYSPIQNSLFYASVALSITPVFVLILATFYFFKKYLKEYAPSFDCYNNEYLKDIYSLGAKFFVTQMCGLVLFGSTNFVISNVISPSEVTVYNIARQYYDMPITFFTMILTPFWSAITEAYVKDDFAWIRRSMSILMKVATLFSVGLIIMAFISDFAFKLWVGDSVSIPLNLSVAFVLYNISVLYMAPYNYFLNGVGKLQLGLWIGIFKTIAFLPVAIFFSKHYGVVGMLMGLFLVNMLPNVIFDVLRYKKIINRTATGIWDK